MHVLNARTRALAITVAACGGSHGAPDRMDAPSAPHVDAPRAPDAPSDAAPVTDPCFPSPHPGHVVYTCNGIAFDVEVPASCPATGCGVIMDVHGLTMSAAMADANDELRMRGSAAGFIVIQPNANPAPPQASWSTTDDPKLFDFLTRAIAVYAIDPKRVHMTGFSQGGFMTWRFLCAHADVLASVAPAAAASDCAGGPACSFTGTDVPSRQMPVLYMHGRMDDDYVPFATCAQQQVDAMVAAWGLADDGVIASSATYTRTRYSAATGGSVEFLAHDYSSSAEVLGISKTRLDGHCYPGSTDPGGLPGQLFPFKCDQAADFTWGVEVVAFFTAHPRE